MPVLQTDTITILKQFSIDQRLQTQGGVEYLSTIGLGQNLS